MVHSGSRGVGNKIGTHFIEKAKEEMRRFFIHLPDEDLAYLPEGSLHFDDYVEAVSWAQDFAMTNRRLMMHQTIDALRGTGLLPPFEAELLAVNCHHNYVAREHHYGKNVLVTRKGAARRPGHHPREHGGALLHRPWQGERRELPQLQPRRGAVMSRNEARRRFTLDDHARATAGIECRKDDGVLDETPAAYKSIEAVMAAQADLVEVVHTLRQVVCVKG